MTSARTTRTSPLATAIPPRTPGEIEAIERAAQVAWSTLERVAQEATPGVTTLCLDEIAQDSLIDAGATSLFRGYRQGSSPPFPGALCVCLDHEVVHGIPSERVLEPGMLLGIDVGVKLDGWCGDSGMSLVVGGQNPAAQALIDDTRQLLRTSIELARPGIRWSHVASAFERETQRLGRGLVTEYVGHGIGKSLHEPPKAPSYWTGFAGEDFTLEVGMVLALEPILTLEPGRDRGLGGPTGRVAIAIRDDGWTVETKGAIPACHEERMVVIEEGGARVLAGSLV